MTSRGAARLAIGSGVSWGITALPGLPSCGHRRADVFLTAGDGGDAGASGVVKARSFLFRLLAGQHDLTTRWTVVRMTSLNRQDEIA